MPKGHRIAAACALVLGAIGNAPAAATEDLFGEAPRQASDEIAPARGSSARGGGYSDARAPTEATRSPLARECTTSCEDEPDLSSMRSCVAACIDTFGYRDPPSPGAPWMGAGLLVTALGAAALISHIAGICGLTAGPEPDAVPEPGCEAAMLTVGTSLTALGPLLTIFGYEKNLAAYRREASLDFRVIVPREAGAPVAAGLAWTF